MRKIAAWLPLLSLLLATLVAAVVFDRGRWPGLVGDEATYLMQAESLAWDFDLSYEREDYDRFLRHWQRQPEGLILLRTPDHPTTFGKPTLYSLYLAPFLRLAPVRGGPVANALLLALAALASALVLHKRLGSSAPLLVAAAVFASVTFAHVFWIHADLFLACLTALALALAYGGRWAHGLLTEIYSDVRDVTTARFWGRWLAVGALLAAVVFSRPFYLPVWLAAFVIVPPVRRRAGWAAVAGGAALFLLLTVPVNLVSRGTWTSYGGQRQGFYSYTGFPEVDLPAEHWAPPGEDRGATWLRWQTLQVGFDGEQTLWNVAYLLAGRHVGLLPYFLPLLFGVFAFRRGEGRGTLALAVVVSLSLFLLLKPFNFFGGGDALANRYFLPLYPVFWFLVGRPIRGRWILALSLAAAPFLYPLWAQPWAFPRTAEGGYHHVSAVAQRWLPYETSQSHLKPSGREDFVHHGLWIKALTPALVPVNDGRRLRLRQGDGSFLLGRAKPLGQVTLVFDPPAPSQLRLRGGVLGKETFLPDGRVSFEVRLSPPRASHRMWWTPDPFYLYELELTAEGESTGQDLSFEVVPAETPTS
jgi:hypothetical protein